MSGIVAMVALDDAPVDRWLLERMTRSLRFRGPDAQETWLEEQAGLGHAMLRTTRASKPDRQPFSLDGRVWIVADSRVDGRAELRRELHALGRYCSEEASDAELVLHAYHAWGEDCVRHLIGDFAVAIWDAPRRRLFCARDHFGVKPLFFARAGGNLLVGNTLDCLRLHPGVSDRPNDGAIADFLVSGINRDPASSAFADIDRLPPAHRLSWCDGELRVDRYWTFPDAGPRRRVDRADCVEEFVARLRTAVEDRMRSERIGVLMSGGLDSTSVAAMAAIVASVAASRCGKTDVEAYCCVFDHLFADEERRFAGLAADKLGIPIHYLPADRYALFEGWLEGGVRLPEPADEPLAAVYIDQARQMSSTCRVALTGWDGDALLSEHVRSVGDLARGGVRRALRAMRIGWHALAGLRGASRRLPAADGAPSASPEWLDRRFAERTAPSTPRCEESDPTARRQPHSGARRVLCSPRFTNLLESYDPGVTRVPLETRHPLLDLRLVEFVLSLPVSPWCVEKRLLRIAMRDALPEAVRLRPKTPLAGDPVIELLQRADATWIDAFAPAPGLARFVNRSAVPEIVGRRDADRMWADLRPLCLNFWLRSLHDTGRADERENYHEVA